MLLLDARGRRYLLRLASKQTFHFHGGAVKHDEIIGAREGAGVVAASGAKLTCLRPRLADFILKMPRGAQVVYPKDLGAILTFADIFPSASILEAGTGSGALAITLARAIGSQGRLVSYELRDDFHERALKNIEAYFGKVPDWVELRTGDVRGAVSGGETFDRMVLDLPEPWGLLEEAEALLLPGGILCAYLPTTVQVQGLVLELERRGFAQVETFEMLLRTWHVTERSVRPDHRMVGHTGFVTVARRVARD